jgi:hypothetical protein
MTKNLENPAPADNAQIIHQYIARLWIVGAWFTVFLASYYQLKIGLNNDNLTLMFQTKQMLNGAKLYVDYADISPPMIHLLYCIPAFLSQLTGLTDYIALKLWALIICYGSILACHAALKHSELNASLRHVLLASIGLALIGVSATHQLYADREHLMIALIMPFILLYSPIVNRQETPIWLRITIGVMAGIGLAIKPYFYVFYLAAIAHTLWRERTLRFLYRDIENYMVGGIAIGYLLIVYLFFPTYLFEILPLGWLTYETISWTMKSKLSVVKNDLISDYALPGIISTVWLIVLRPATHKHWLGYAICMLAAGTMSYLLNAGWRYTQYPFMAVSFVITIMVTANLFVLLADRRDRSAMLQKLLVLSICAIAVGYIFGKPAYERAILDANIQESYGKPLESKSLPAPVMKHLGPHLKSHPKFLLLSTSVWAVNIMRQVPGSLHVGRFDYLWMVPGLLSMEWRGIPPETFVRMRNYTAKAIADDMMQKKPDMIILERSKVQRALPNDFDIWRFLVNSPEFAEAWTHYSTVDIINVCPKEGRANDCAYEILYRNPD